jgi:hypothetical protein
MEGLIIKASKEKMGAFDMIWGTTPQRHEWTPRDRQNLFRLGFRDSLGGVLLGNSQGLFGDFRNLHAARKNF